MLDFGWPRQATSSQVTGIWCTVGSNCVRPTLGSAWSCLFSYLLLGAVDDYNITLYFTRILQTTLLNEIGDQWRVFRQQDKRPKTGQATDVP